MKANVQKLEDFNVTKKEGTRIYFDDDKRQFLIPKSIFGSIKGAIVYSYNDIADFELVENGGSSGGLGRALVGGALLGMGGAIVGGSTGNKSVVHSLQIKITTHDFDNPVILISLISTKMKTSSLNYKIMQEQAQRILSILSIIVAQNKMLKEGEKSSTNNVDKEKSIADELIKFKGLMDSGIITQEDFEKQKRRLLN